MSILLKVKWINGGTSHNLKTALNLVAKGSWQRWPAFNLEQLLDNWVTTRDLIGKLLCPPTKAGSLQKFNNIFSKYTRMRSRSVPLPPKKIEHLFMLLLGSLVCPKLSFCHLKSTLVLTNPQKRSDALLIWCQSSNFPNHAPYETGPDGSFLKSPKKNNVLRKLLKHNV